MPKIEPLYVIDKGEPKKIETIVEKDGNRCYVTGGLLGREFFPESAYRDKLKTESEISAEVETVAMEINVTRVW